MTLGVKICGLSEPETLHTAITYGAGMVGFVFYEKSPRHVSLATAKELGAHVPKSVKKVALIVDAEDGEITDIITALDPDYLQAHGGETPERIREMKARFKLPVIKAVAVKDENDLLRADAFLDICDILLLDAKAPETLRDALPGGNGITFDWSLLSGHKPKTEFMLSGGLNPDNLPQAIKTTKPDWVDVSSGVETSPGVKDKKLIRQFLETAKSVCNDQ